MNGRRATRGCTPPHRTPLTQSTITGTVYRARETLSRDTPPTRVNGGQRPPAADGAPPPTGLSVGGPGDAPLVWPRYSSIGFGHPCGGDFGSTLSCSPSPPTPPNPPLPPRPTRSAHASGGSRAVEDHCPNPRIFIRKAAPPSDSAAADGVTAGLRQSPAPQPPPPTEASPHAPPPPLPLLRHAPQRRATLSPPQTLLAWSPPAQLGVWPGGGGGTGKAHPLLAVACVPPRCRLRVACRAGTVRAGCGRRRRRHRWPASRRADAPGRVNCPPGRPARESVPPPQTPHRRAAPGPRSPC